MPTDTEHPLLVSRIPCVVSDSSNGSTCLSLRVSGKFLLRSSEILCTLPLHCFPRAEGPAASISPPNYLDRLTEGPAAGRGILRGCLFRVGASFEDERFDKWRHPGRVQSVRGAWCHSQPGQVPLGRSRECPNMKGRPMAAPWPPKPRSHCTPLGSDEACVLDAQNYGRQIGVCGTRAFITGRGSLTARSHGHYHSARRPFSSPWRSAPQSLLAL